MPSWLYELVPSTHKTYDVLWHVTDSVENFLARPNVCDEQFPVLGIIVSSV